MVPRHRITTITPIRFSCVRVSVIAFARINPIANKYRKPAIIGCCQYIAPTPNPYSRGEVTNTAGQSHRFDAHQCNPALRWVTTELTRLVLCSLVSNTSGSAAELSELRSASALLLRSSAARSAFHCWL